MEYEKYILPKYTPFKDKPSFLALKFVEPNNQLIANTHSQLQCPELSFPFARTKICKSTLTYGQMLVESNAKEQLLETGKSVKTVMEICLDISESEDIVDQYQPGDTIGILPINASNEVEDILDALHLTDKADECCTFEIIQEMRNQKGVKLPPHMPAVTTPRRLLTECLNIKTVLKKQFLSCLAEYCSNQLEAQFLKCLSSKEASQQYNELFMGSKPMLLGDLLQHCRSCKPTLALLVEHLPRLLPRPYSIANSPLDDSQNIKIIFSLLPVNPGITTNMLKLKAEEIKKDSFAPSPKVHLYLRNINSFRYTEKEFAQNQILIAIGTALAPFLGFLQHKRQLIGNNIPNPGQTWLFVGASNTKSLFHRNVLQELHSKQILNRYYESLSRDTDAPCKYVQDQLKENCKDFVQFLLDPTTSLYVCADGADISKSIETCVTECLHTELNIELSEAEQMLKDFRRNGKYREDLWL